MGFLCADDRIIWDAIHFPIYGLQAPLHFFLHYHHRHILPFLFFYMEALIHFTLHSFYLVQDRISM